MKQQKSEPLSIPAVSEYSGEAGEAAVTQGKPLAAEKWLMRKFLAAMGHPPIQVALWDGEDLCSPGRPPMARVLIRNRSALYRLLVNPNLHFGDDYSTGLIDVEGELIPFLEAVGRHMPPSWETGFLKRNVLDRLNPPRHNTLTGSKNNIHHHYDISNDFYRLWLDQEMVYTCAYYAQPDMTLEAAQFAKMEHVCRKLQLKPGETVVEAGCGWGSLARHMARHHGVKVKAFNISKEQLAYARARAKAEGLDDRIEYIEDDYRNIAGQFDAFVSVGMLEHVGPDHYLELGGVIDRALGPDGRGLIHSIGRNFARLMNGWIEHRIFPGACPPSLRQMMDIFEPWNFSVLDVENLRLHYAQTLRHWLERYEEHVHEVNDMFDERFVRAWRLYLAGSIASFTTGSLQLFQVLFARGTTNQVPWTRAHLYEGP